MMVVQLVLGFVLLVAGGEALVRGASALAERAGVSPLLIGLTLVGFGSSTPELVTSVQAAMIGSPGIALGNIVGSNIANILLILGLSGLIMPIVATRKTLARDGLLVLATTLAMFGLAAAGALGRPAGALLVAGLILYLLLAYLTERTPGHAAGDQLAAPEKQDAHAMGAPLALAYTIGGLVLVVLGGRFLVMGAVDLARSLHVSESVIGLTIVAVGTSLPELVTSVVAAMRRQADIALGNILGSNIYNVLGIGGLTAIIAPVRAPSDMLVFDFPAMIAATVLLLIFLWTRFRLERWEAGVLLSGYVAYMAAVWM